jgi:hypothetical protein
MGTYDYIWEHHMEQIENHLKLEEYIWEHLAYLQEFLKISKNSHRTILNPKEKNLLKLYQLGHMEPKFWLEFSAPFYPGKNGRPNS